MFHVAWVVQLVCGSHEDAHGGSLPQVVNVTDPCSLVTLDGSEATCTGVAGLDNGPCVYTPEDPTDSTPERCASAEAVDDVGGRRRMLAGLDRMPPQAQRGSRRGDSQAAAPTVIGTNDRYDIIAVQDDDDFLPSQPAQKEAPAGAAPSCIAWRQTANCIGDGTREVRGNL